MSQGIFISYRRSDSAGYAHALATRLVQQFGSASVFMDVDSLEPGVDFVETIGNSLSSCKILISLIGNNWIGPQEEGQPRIIGYSDYVRIEVADALERGIRVIPVLVDDAVMPRAVDLPDDLDSLTRRQAIEWSNTRFNSDLDRIVGAIKKAISQEEAGKNKSGIPAPGETATPVEAAVDQLDATNVESGQNTEEKESEAAQATPETPVLEPGSDRTALLSFLRFPARLGLAAALGLGVFYITESLVHNTEITSVAGIIASIITLVLTVRGFTLARILSSLFLAGAVSFAALNWMYVIHTGAELARSVDSARPSSTPRPAPSPALPVTPPARGSGSLRSFQVVREYRDDRNRDVIEFYVEFNYSGPSSRVCVGAEQAFNGIRLKYYGYRPYCQDVVSNQASGKALVMLSTSMPDDVTNFTSNQVYVVLREKEYGILDDHYFPFQKTWKK